MMGKSMDVQRYDWRDMGMVPDPNGNYVLHAAHIAALAAKDAEIADLKVEASRHAAERQQWERDWHEMRGQASLASSERDRMFVAINRFRNLEQLRTSKLRNTAEFGELCHAWEAYADRLTEEGKDWSAVIDAALASTAPVAANCEYCGPVCYGGAEHNERVENNWKKVAPVAEAGQKEEE